MAMVIKERHLWVNMANIGEKEKGFVLNAPVSPSELFGTSVEVVVDKFKEVKVQAAAFKTFILCRPGSAPMPKQLGGPGPSWAHDQKASVATLRNRSQRRCEARKKKHDFREVIQSRTDEECECAQSFI